MLLDPKGAPLFDPTLFAVTELRMRNLASNTIGNALRAIQMFMAFLGTEGIDLRKRFVQGEVLKLHEVEALARASRKPLAATLLSEGNRTDSAAVSSRVARLEGFRSRLPYLADECVSPAVAATRLQCIRDYVRWLAEVHLSSHESTLAHRGDLRAAVDVFSQALDARMPNGASSAEREGIAPDVRIKLHEATRPDSADNPWKERHSRKRNALMVDWLYHLGVRRGELLSVRVSDVDFRRSIVAIMRRPDDAGDPRRNQPTVKTRARELPISPGLLEATRDYVINVRASLPKARRHEFLFVASDTGAPLSMSALAKVFAVLRAKVPQLPDDLTPHVLRHTWNDRFSEEMDQRKVEEATERKARSYLMGWSETSGTAATYTRRHVREKAKRVSLELQERLMKRDEGKQ